MSAKVSVFDFTKQSDSKDVYKASPNQMYQLLVTFSSTLQEVGEYLASDLIQESADYFKSNHDIEDNETLVIIKSKDDALKLFNLDYVGLHSGHILQLLACYAYAGKVKTACYIWLFNQEDNLDEKNKYGIDLSDCLI